MLGDACEEARVAIEMRAHGALAPGLVSSLEEHLAGCAACTEYLASIPAHDAILAPDRPAPDAHAELARRRFSATLRRQRDSRRAVIGLALLGVVLFLGNALARREFADAVAVLTALGVGVALRRVYHQRYVAPLLGFAGTVPFLEAHRRFLVAERLRRRKGRWVALTVSLACFVAAWRTPTASSAAITAFMGVVVAVAAYVAGWRQLAEIEAESAGLPGLFRG
jgi:hypothetical protein